jgi:hypothetical protein
VVVCLSLLACDNRRGGLPNTFAGVAGRGGGAGGAAGAAGGAAGGLGGAGTFGAGGASGSGAGGSGGSGGGSGSGGSGDDCAGCTFVKTAAFGHHLLFDAGRNLIYVSADSAAPANKSSLVTVDPASGNVVSTTPLGPDPGPMALSDDGSTLWVGVAPSNIQRVALGTPPVAGTIYPLPSSGAVLLPEAASLAVLPGTTSSIVVAVNNALGVYVLDNGVPRPTYVHSSDAINAFLVRGPNGVLFGFNESTQFGVLEVTPKGVAQTTFPGLISGSNARTLIYDGGLVLVSDGEVIDATNPDAPVRAGQFDDLGDAMALRSPTRALMLVADGTPSATPLLRVLDTTTFTSVATAAFPQSAVGQLPSLGDMAYLGGDAVAFLVSATAGNISQLVIMHAAVIGSPP